MAKTKVSEFDAVASNNTDINSVNVAEGCPPSGINNAIREMASLLKKQEVGTDAMTSPDINGGTIDGATIGGSSGVTIGVSDGTVSAPSIKFTSDTNTGIYRGGTDILKFVTAGTDAITIDASQGVTLAGKLDVSSGTIKLNGNYPVGTANIVFGEQAYSASATGGNNVAIGYQSQASSTSGNSNVSVGRGTLYAITSGGENTAMGNLAMASTSTGTSNVGLGVQALYTNTTGGFNTGVGRQALYSNTTASYNTALGYQTLLANTTASYNTALGGLAGYSTTSVQNTFIGQQAGYYVTSGEKNTIIGRYNGNQGGLDIRTSSNHIVLSDGDGNPRIINHGSVSGAPTSFGTTATNLRDQSGGSGGVILNAGGLGLSDFARSEQEVVAVNRLGNDGVLVSLRQDGTPEGTISVSGTTVSYNGGHLSRWSRLADDSKDTSIVKGTVMTNLDAMVEWGDEDNEQLNKMAVSSVEGDANVAGVFVNWDNDDDWNDMNVAMTGDMVIRIAQGTTVARGDLLMSAGDGTAKPQGDDIVRSKTIAKVTSTNVSHTYDDGTYLVPCVLMAC